MIFTGKFFDSFTVQALTGIQVSSSYKYELIKMSFDDFSFNQQQNLKEQFDDFTNDNYYVECMVNRLKLGGTLAAIIVTMNPDGLMIADGCHRTYAHMILNTKEFYALIKIPNGN